MKASEYEAAFEKKPARTVFHVILLCLLVMTAIGIVGWGIRMILYPAQQAGRIIEKTLDADNVLYNYEWFKSQYQDVLAIDNKLTAAEVSQKSFEQSAGPRDTWKFDDRTEWNRLNSIVLGLRNQRASIIAEYNARSEMANRSIFKTGDLPEKLNLN